jgi:hypothetical protein
MRNPKYRIVQVVIPATLLILIAVTPAVATPFFFSTGDPDGKIATASSPSSTGKIEIESADDFVLSQDTSITSATFTGLLVGASPTDVLSVGIEIYRVFPKDSDVTRTSGPPTFGTSQVPTRVNSPGDVAFDTLDSTAGGLTFSTNLLSATFAVLNSVRPGGIHPTPNQTTGGDGPITGMEVQFDLTFPTALDLLADHYFFVPLVGLNSGEFYWLSAPRPIVPPGTPFSPDLQTWTRDENLAPDWLRVGTDIVGGSPAPTFNAAFSLTGKTTSVQPVPEPATMLLLGTGLGGLGLSRIRKRKR